MAVEITTAIRSTSEPFKPNQPIVVLLHGYGSNERDLPGLMSYLPGNLPWVSVRAPMPVSGDGFAWFPLTTPGNPLPEHVAEGTDRLWAWIDANLPATAPLIVLGFSQGGLMTTQLLRTRPDRLIGTAVLAGFTVNAEQPGDAELSNTRPSVIYCRGLDDQVITQDAVSRIENWLETHTTATVKTYKRLGHSIDERVMNDVSEYFTKELGISSRNSE